jgi:hypothetical protein
MCASKEMAMTGMRMLALLLALLFGNRAGAADIDPAAAAACGPGFSPVILCGGEEALCVPEGCTAQCVSCCPPCAPMPCGPDPSSAECQGASCGCDQSCGCFTVTIDRSKMAPLLEGWMLAVLSAALLGVGLLLANRRRRSRAF